MESSESEVKKCSTCKTNQPLSSFVNEYDKTLATCSYCRKTKHVPKHVCETCGIKALYNSPGEESGRFCVQHQEVGMIKVTKKGCHHVGCKVAYPLFNLPTKKKGVYCYEHKTTGMIDVVNPRCIEPNCVTHPSFNLPTEKKGIYCYEHKKPDMVNIVNIKCIEPNCVTIPSFNLPTEKKKLYCSEHKKPGMIDVVNPRCIESGCTLQPSFNLLTEKKGLYCSEHKQPDMVNVKSPRCINNGCILLASFNLPTEKKKLYCSEHKQPGMIDIGNSKCIELGCTLRPNFNLPTEKKGLYCYKHKQPGMIDVMNPRCNKCDLRASFAYCGQTKTFCAKHKLPFMFRKSKPKCSQCNELATYGKTEPIHCQAHATNEELCLLRATCKQCNEIDVLNREGLCMTTCSLVKLDNAHKKNQKEKENLMCRYLNSSCKDLESEYKVVDDHIIDTMCNLYRPDRRYDCGTHMVIVECDEFQHKNRSLCMNHRDQRHAEDKRMYDIQQACGGIPCIFIRWNPDTFRVNDIICKKYNMNKRLEMLTKWVKHCIKLDIIGIQSPCYIQLFYDGYNETNTSFTVITEKDVL